MNAQYNAGYLCGKRDGKALRSPERTCHRTRDFQHGYSDGYHAGSGGVIL